MLLPEGRETQPLQAQCATPTLSMNQGLKGRLVTLSRPRYGRILRWRVGQSARPPNYVRPGHLIRTICSTSLLLHGDDSSVHGGGSSP